MKDITHIERPSLPWRDDHVTECGLDASKHPTWTRDEAIAHGRDLGRTRFAMVACITCMQTAERWPTWEFNPAGCLGRFTERWAYARDREDAAQFERELRAIARLVDSHRSEFDDLVASLAATVDLDQRRRAARRR